MKQGRSLAELAAELERQNENRKDFVAKQGAISLRVQRDPQTEAPVTTTLHGLNGMTAPLNSHAHGQFSAHLGIPKAYYDRMLEQTPDLLCDNVNTWLMREPDKRRMVRTLDRRVRAFLSDRYRPLDNYDLLSTALPSLQEIEAKVVSSEVTEQRLYVKAIMPKLCEEIPEGLELGKGHTFAKKDMLIAAIIISNSEIGAGTLRIEAGMYKTRCTNLAIFADAGMKKYHIGRSAVAELDSAVEVFTDETRQQDDKAFWMKVRDVVSATCNPEMFKAQIEKVRAATEDRILNDDLPAVMEVTAKKFGLSEKVRNSTLKNLIQGQDFTRWGLLNAITRTSQDVEDYDEATNLEHLGGKVLELPRSDWKVISEAA